jgi:hypothetical protein
MFQLGKLGAQILPFQTQGKNPARNDGMKRKRMLPQAEKAPDAKFFPMTI